MSICTVFTLWASTAQWVFKKVYMKNNITRAHISESPSIRGEKTAEKCAKTNYFLKKYRPVNDYYVGLYKWSKPPVESVKLLKKASAVLLHVNDVLSTVIREEFLLPRPIPAISTTNTPPTLSILNSEAVFFESSWKSVKIFEEIRQPVAVL